MDPPDTLGVVRARTKLGHLRLWVIPRIALRATASSEFGGGVYHPGIYILVNTEKRGAYVGESADLKTRLGNWAEKPPAKLGNFDTIYILNDGRSSAHSLFTDETLRKGLEQWTVAALKDYGGYATANEQENPPVLSVQQKAQFTHLSEEMGYTLYNLEVIGKVPPVAVDDSPALPADAATRFPGRTLTVKTRFEGELDGATVFFTEGSPKTKGGRPVFQLTIRGSERWKDMLLAGNGFVCWTRGPCYLVPISELKTWLGAKLEQQTVDIFLDLSREVILCDESLPELPVGTYRGSRTGSMQA
jgi:hypothetical protein